MDYQEISSLQHPLVKHLVKLRQNNGYRHDQKSVVIEGIKLLSEINQNFKAKTILTTNPRLLEKGFQADKIYVTTEDVMKKVSGMITPEGILAEFPLPSNTSLEGMNRIIVLDSINDPGNLGTLLRTALALGWEGVFIAGNSCDPYNEKALRASRGACFNMPLQQGSWPELRDLALRNSLTPLLADLKGVSPATIKAKKFMLVLSNEAHGPSKEAIAFCQRVTIPLSGEMESLNVAVAGAILMYVLIERA
ncbi:MAG: RNA methyltransferase [Parachlamydiaceae bacterium]|nr:RNA methyltransferase [Parachlamydiaceae bacterium]